MSIPTNEAGLKDYLLSNDELYRELAAEHRRFDDPGLECGAEQLVGHRLHGFDVGAIDPRVDVELVTHPMARPPELGGGRWNGELDTDGRRHTPRSRELPFPLMRAS